MTEWYLWDGESQRGPMDRQELDNHIQSHPNGSAIRLWRAGFSGWKMVDEALDLTRANAPDSLSDQPLKEATRSKHHNFVAQNWRGEYPLWVSYWIIGFLGNLFAMAIIAVANTFIKSSFNPFGILSFFLLLWSFVTLVSIWQWVGIWRSSDRMIAERVSSGRKARWARVAKIMVCLGILQLVGVLIRTAIPQIAEATRIALMDDPDIPAYAIRVMNNGSEAEIAGGIKFGLTSDFEKVLNASRGVRVVHLDSVGGRIGEGQKLHDLIKSRSLDTYVDVKCLSACTLAFVAGSQRILKQGAKLGFHRGAFAGEDQIDGSLERSIYAAAGVSRPFVEHVMSTKNADMWQPSETDLVAAGVVTKISTGDEYAMPGDGGRLTRDDWDKGLQKTKVYLVMKERYPKAYGEILDTFFEGTTKGMPRAQVIGQARAKLNSIIKVLLPDSDDAVLVDFGRLVVDQYRAIQVKDTAACYRFASGQDDDASRLLPTSLTQRELELDAQIISSARKQDRTAPNNETSWGKIVAGLGRHGYTTKDIQLLSAKSVSSSDFARYCDLTIVLYQEVVTLPMKDAAAILREFFS